MKYVVYMCLLVWFTTACHNKKKEYSEDHYGTHDREYVEEREDKTLYYGGQEVDSLGYMESMKAPAGMGRKLIKRNWFYLIITGTGLSRWIWVMESVPVPKKVLT